MPVDGLAVAKAVGSKVSFQGGQVVKACVLLLVGGDNVDAALIKAQLVRRYRRPSLPTAWEISRLGLNRPSAH